MKRKTNSLQEIAETLIKRDGFTIITHVSPDGDAVGSALALYRILHKMGKRAQVVCDNPVPRVYQFLPGAETVLRPVQAAAYQNAVCVDCSDELRMGEAARIFERAELTINIDHHATNMGHAQLNYIDERAAATAQIIHQLIGLFPGAPDKDTAVCLYVGLITDTGSFSYSNTTPDTLYCAAELMRLGIDTAQLNMRVFHSVPVQRLRLHGFAIKNIALLYESRVSFVSITREDIARYGALDEDTEGIIDYARDIDTVQIAVFMRESDYGRYKLSLRSKGDIDVSLIARAFGGGGHVNAAGYTDSGSYEDAKGRILMAAKGALEA